MKKSGFFRINIKISLAFSLSLSRVESRVGLSLPKVETLHIILNIDGTTITCKSHTHPSHSQTSRLLTSTLSLGVPRPLMPPLTLICSTSMFPSYIPKTCSMITDRSGSTHSSSLRPIDSLLTSVTRSLNPSLQDQAFSTPSSVRSIPEVSFPLTKALEASSSPRPSSSPKQTDDQVACPPSSNPKGNTLHSKWWSLLLRAPKRVAEMVVGLAYPQLPPSRQLPSSHESLRVIKCSFCRGKKEHTACTKDPELDGSASSPYRASKNSLSHVRPKCGRIWFPGKGTRNMAPQVSGLFYTTNL